ncbi:MAG: amidophosphoribosyltransferase [Coriobacteriales bacterium]|nr:amidophosphoribosyltransferase [Coriobacteriales bacterium]
MGGFFGCASTDSTVFNVFFGTDYHSHLGTKNAGMAFLKDDKTFVRQIHSITNMPFRARFDGELNKFSGNIGVGCISDSDPQPLVFKSHLGVFCLCSVGNINNSQEIIDKHLKGVGAQFMAMGDGKVNDNELIAYIINQKKDFVSGIKYAQDIIDGSISLLIVTQDANIIASRDPYGRLPIKIGKNDTGYCVALEHFAYKKLGFDDFYDLGPGEIVSFTTDKFEVLSPATNDLKICSFLWVYYGYPNSIYEGKNVEVTRYKNGEIMAQNEIDGDGLPHLDSVAGVPDSGIPHAIGFAKRAQIDFTRPFVKYTPSWSRSFTPSDQIDRNRIAKMKQIPVTELIKDKDLLFVDDSIVRGTQLKKTVDFLYECGAKNVHMRSACPPILYSCKYLSFTRAKSEMELIARRTVSQMEGTDKLENPQEYLDTKSSKHKCMVKEICKDLKFSSLDFQSIEGLIEAIGLKACKLCTYCFTGIE